MLAKKLDDGIVCTDDKKILDVVRSYGGKAELTSKKHRNGTERIYEIAKDFRIENQLESIPLNLSGGQRRRFGLAKIISSNPKIIIADEPVASLDVSIKRDIMNVLFDLKKKNMTIVVISHDIALLQEKADFIFVFDKGKIVEKWNPKIQPEHIETKKLLDDSDFVNEFIKNVKV